jgi:long-chain fatty acid transport protein
MLFVASTAHAGVEDTFGMGTRPMALGGSFAARPGSFAAAYYNPAGLVTQGEKGGLFEASVALLYAHPQLHVKGANGAELSMPEVTGSQDAFGTPDTAGLVIGSRFAVGQPLHIEGLDMGFALYLPPHLFRWAIRPDDDIQWALLTDRTQVLSAEIGLAYRLTKWLSLGASARILFDAQTLTSGRVTSVAIEKDPATGKTVVRTHTQLGVDSQVFGRVTPIFGAMFTPTDRLRIGLVYRHQSQVDDWGNTRITGVPSFGDLGYTHRFAHYFEPSQVTVAGAVDLGAGFDVSVDLTYALWSEAQSTNRNQFGGAIWGNTLTPAVGLQWRMSPALGLMAGYRFQRSPLSNFGGPTNLLDCDRHVLSAGFDVGIGKLLGTTFDPRLVASASSMLLVERTERKEFQFFPSDRAWMSNAGYPSYTYGGHVLAVSAGLEAQF